MELSEVIDQELAENPALERPDDDLCSSCTLPKELCSDCPQRVKQSKEEPEPADWRDLYARETASFGEQASLDDPDFDPLENVCSQMTLHDFLRDQLHATVEPELYTLGEYIIGGINPSGYFEGDLEEISMDTATDPEVVQQVLEIIQWFDPPGVGARTLQECLLIQLQTLDERTATVELALRMVRDFWHETSNHKVSRLASQLKASRGEVEEALQFITTSLKPHPGENFRPPWDNSQSSAAPVQPDIIVRRTMAGYEVEVLVSDAQLLAINNTYRSAYSRIRNGGARDYSSNERRHVVEYVERANIFIQSIAQRRKTLRAITKFVLEYQQGYLETGQKSFMRPLTKTQVARALEVHESTVSRATANKWVQLPTEEVVGFDVFFDGATSVRDVIAEIIAGEDKSRPLSDQEIAEMLQERGLTVARRTVMKYREAMNILSSRRRRRAS